MHWLIYLPHNAEILNYFDLNSTQYLIISNKIFHNYSGLGNYNYTVKHGGSYTCLKIAPLGRIPGCYGNFYLS